VTMMEQYGNDLNAHNARRAAALRSSGGMHGGGRKVGSSSNFATGYNPQMYMPTPQANPMQTLQSGMQLYSNGKNMYDMFSGGNAASSAGNAGSFFNSGNSSVQAAGLADGASSGAGAASGAGASGASSAGSGATGAMGQGLAYLGAAKTALDFTNAMGQKQGVEGRDKGNLGGQLGAAGSGAASGFSLGGPIGAIVGAAGGNEAYQMQHGNREGDLKTVLGGGDDFDFKKSLEYYLKGGPAGADIKGWLGL